MKQTPELNEAQARMQPGVISGPGFLGEDSRALRAIVDEDGQRIAAQRSSHTDIGRRLRELTDAARSGMGTPVVVDDVFEVSLEEARGAMPCPWPHAGTFRKGAVHLRHLDTGEELAWTELSIHMIEAHGFYGGTGSPFRLAPSSIRKVLNL